MWDDNINMGVRCRMERCVLDLSDVDLSQRQAFVMTVFANL
jgi:hypothetical protein